MIYVDIILFIVFYAAMTWATLPFTTSQSGTDWKTAILWPLVWLVVAGFVVRAAIAWLWSKARKSIGWPA
jgi:hypothetical protein